MLNIFFKALLNDILSLNKSLTLNRIIINHRNRWNHQKLKYNFHILFDLLEPEAWGSFIAFNEFTYYEKLSYPFNDLLEEKEPSG